MVPITELINDVPDPVPEFVTVPMLLIGLVESVIVPTPVAFNVKLPVPVIPPLSVKLFAAGDNLRSWLSVTAPLKILATLSVIVAIPELPLATEIGFVNVPTNPPFSVASAEPVVLPMVIVPLLPKALALVVPVTVPALMVVPVVYVLTPESVKNEVRLF